MRWRPSGEEATGDGVRATSAAAASSAPWQHNTASSDGAFLLDLLTTGTLAVRSNLPTALHSGTRLHQHAVSNWRHALVLPSHSDAQVHVSEKGVARARGDPSSRQLIQRRCHQRTLDGRAPGAAATALSGALVCAAQSEAASVAMPSAEESRAKNSSPEQHARPCPRTQARDERARTCCAHEHCEAMPSAHQA